MDTSGLSAPPASTGHPLEGDNLLPSALKRGARRCRICNAEKQRQYRAAHPSYSAAAAMCWTEKNLERKRAYDRGYNETVSGHKPRTPRPLLLGESKYGAGDPTDTLNNPL